MYDYLIVGAGLSGSVCAYELKKRCKKCLVIDKRSNIAGNLYTEKRDGINVHVYGAHIFHTSNKGIWDYVNSFVHFHNFINSPIASYNGKLYNLPFNMNTFYALWGLKTPNEVMKKISKERKEIKSTPKNLEEQAISLVGREVYEILIKDYTKKQWGRDCKDLSADIIKRLPVRFRFDNNYFNDEYQGIPEDGYTQMIEKMLENVDVELNVDFNKNRDEYTKKAKKVIYTGMLDALFDFKYGELEYRSEKFEHECIKSDNIQGVAVVNHTGANPIYTRSIEHKHFEYWKNIESGKSWISYEYPVDYKETGEPYYPVNNDKNNSLWQQYATLAKDKGIILVGRLALYKYFDMDKVIENTFEIVNSLD